MSDIRVEMVENVTAFLGKVTAKMARGLEHVSGPLTDAIRDLYRKRFESQGSYGGTRWAELSESTMRKRDRAGLSGLILERYGTLDASFTQEGALGLTVRGAASSRAFGYSVLVDGGRTLAVGSGDPVLNLTEHGTKNMPARPVLPDEIPEADAERFAELVADSLMESLE